MPSLKHFADRVSDICPNKSFARVLLYNCRFSNGKKIFIRFHGPGVHKTSSFYQIQAVNEK